MPDKFCTTYFYMMPNQVASETLQGIECNRFEIEVGKSKSLALLSRILFSFAYSVISGRD